MLSKVLISFLLAGTLSLCASSPPTGSITVGPEGQYPTLSAALTDISSNVYFIYGTIINERVVITRPNITVYGQTSGESTYAENLATIYNNIPASAAGSGEASATVSIHASATDVKLYNLNIANTYGRGSQAIALSINSTRFGAYGINLTGYQDTLLTMNGLHFFSKGCINGAVDFYVIDQSNIMGAGKQYLGRPWRSYARVVFQNSVLGSQIQPAGWSEWAVASPETDNIFYGEYNNTGPGAWDIARVSFATNMTEGLTMDTVFGGSTSWVETDFL
ncbi:putative pectinesterase A [Rhizoctonia solani AG-1 IB]|uniref:pectinesterase n=1 Tax=Thanatephorus cucumeris (strain AG1-IB / isolate 7/3/14) TaxID=1108050 RepID=M5C6M3_THACB|nr:putative pectinesterase A [Rhizoctonia solani AG-1 IB]